MSPWFRNSRLANGFALGAVVLSVGGLILVRSRGPVGSAPAFAYQAPYQPAPKGQTSTAFSGPGLKGTLGISHSKVLAGIPNQVFVEIDLEADKSQNERTRAAISMAIVLDISGSMSGEKIERGKQSIQKVIDDMRDDDQIAIVAYSDTARVVQSLVRVGDARPRLKAAVGALQPEGGTNIPSGLQKGFDALAEVSSSRVRRVVLMSDGLDSTRVQAEQMARMSAAKGIAVSSLGIGVDFDESYMSSVANAGRGNFAFVKDGASLATFLHRELDEASTTTIDNAVVKLQLPAGAQFVSAEGAEASMNERELSLAVGSMFAGDKRRITVELSMIGGRGETKVLGASAAWRRVGGAAQNAVAKLDVTATDDPKEVEDGRDGAVFARTVSVRASKVQLEAARAYASGNRGHALQLIERNQIALRVAASAAPPEVAAPLMRQAGAYDETRQQFDSLAPSSEGGKAAAKAAHSKDIGNLSRSSY